MNKGNKNNGNVGSFSSQAIEKPKTIDLRLLFPSGVVSSSARILFGTACHIITTLATKPYQKRRKRGLESPPRHRALGLKNLTPSLRTIGPGMAFLYIFQYSSGALAQARKRKKQVIQNFVLKKYVTIFL